MAQQPPLPAIGTKAVHKNDYEKTQGPVWEVTEHLNTGNTGQAAELYPPAIRLKWAKHKLNITPVMPKTVTPEDFRDNYKVL